jgi:hypothetical protein
MDTQYNNTNITHRIRTLRITIKLQYPCIRMFSTTMRNVTLSIIIQFDIHHY